HRPASQNRINADRLSHPLPRENLPDSIGTEHALVIAAFAAIAARRPEWDLLIIGDGPLRGSLEGSLPADLQRRVTWTGFLDHQATVSALYRSCAVLLLPSDFLDP